MGPSPPNVNISTKSPKLTSSYFSTQNPHISQLRKLPSKLATIIRTTFQIIFFSNFFSIAQNGAIGSVYAQNPILLGDKQIKNIKNDKNIIKNIKNDKDNDN